MLALLGAGIVILLLISTVALEPAVRAADQLFEKVRYTSICTKCGEQSTCIYYLVIGTEILSSESVLAVSTTTAIRKDPYASCPHEKVLIGKSHLRLTKAFDLRSSRIGALRGWEFRGENLEETLSTLAGMRSGSVLGHMEIRCNPATVSLPSGTDTVNFAR